MKPNPFIEWGSHNTVEVNSEESGLSLYSLYMSKDMMHSAEIKVVRIYDNKREIQTEIYRYPRDMLLVKGVDYV